MTDTDLRRHVVHLADGRAVHLRTAGSGPPVLLCHESPRSSVALTLLAGFLAVSPTWLLHGVGESPTDGDLSSELTLIASSLKALKDNHDRTGEMIERLEAQVAALQSGAGAGSAGE